MVYAGTCGGQPVHLGVSGRLKDRNLVMWDEQTDSLWSQIRGTALYGKRKGQQLELVPAVFVGFGTWKKMEPKTMVLDLSLVRATSWHYKTGDLARGRVGRQKLGIGLRKGGHTLAVPLDVLQQRKAIAVEVGGTHLVTVWIPEEKAALVYRLAAAPEAEPSLVRGQLRVAGRRYDALTGRSIDADLRPLERFGYIPTYLGAWRRYYPKGKVYGAE